MSPVLYLIVLLAVQCVFAGKRPMVMLLDGLFEYEGNVIVYNNDRWGPICDDNWGINEANVICRELGYSYAIRATTGDFFRSYEREDFTMDDVTCNGRENTIFECTYWSTHDCRAGQIAGAICYKEPQVKKRTLDWNPLELPFNRTVLESYSKISFQLSFKHLSRPNDTKITVPSVHIGKISGGICADNFGLLEATVICRQLNFGFGKEVRIVDNNSAQNLLRVYRCFGNESTLNDCQYYAGTHGQLCSSQNTSVAVRCTEVLPDLAPDVPAIQNSLYMDIVTLRHVACAVEEGCFPPVVYRLAQRAPYTYHIAQRRLLRFSSIISNIGTADFKPYQERETWEWHACHQHFHSMKVFAHYEVYDHEMKKVSVGHKASFCLEDNMCAEGVTKKFVCSTLKSNKGNQGISPGCSDNYLHNYDCQWIDVSELRVGTYTFRVCCCQGHGPIYYLLNITPFVILNPDFLVPETTFFNNGVACQLNLGDGFGTLSGCRMIHPLEL